MVNGCHVSLRRHRSVERNSSFCHFCVVFRTWYVRSFRKNRCWRRTEFCWDAWHRVTGWWSNTVLERILCYIFVTNWLRNSGKMKRYPYDNWTVRIWTVKFPGDIWIVEIWTVKTGLGLRLGLDYLLGLDLGLGLVLGFELVLLLLLLLLLVFRLGLRLGLWLVMTVQFMTSRLRRVTTEQHPPHFLAHVYCRQMAGWIKMPFGMAVRVGPDTLCYMGTQLPHKGHSSPLNFGRCLLWPNGCMDQNVTWYAGRPQRRQHCVRWHVQIGKRFEPSTVLWAFYKIQPSGSDSV